ncbi:M1 family metallopeptidase [Nocardioides fonticola]|uniref:M1 family metallopeptidase n=1 Tax=Nocardioides fonticola TaxID=450363 RepID=UPI0031CE3D90
MAIRSVLAALLAVPLLLTPASGRAAATTTPVDPYFPDDGQRGLDVVHYDIAVRHDPRVGRLAGRATLAVTARTTLRTVHLDLWLPVHRVRVDGREVSWRQEAGDLAIRPPRAWQCGSSHRVEVAYAGRPGRVGPSSERPFVTDGVESVVAGEPHAAAWWFPADDRPTDRARVDLRITVPARGRLTSISGGRLLAQTRAGDWRTRHWRFVDPVAPYLVLLAVGPYRERVTRALGRPMRIAVSGTLPAARRRSALDLLGRTPEAVRWLQQVLRTPYPFADLGGVVTGLDLGFALETQTRPIHPAVVPDPLPTLVHELAHQWFGDAVPVRRWRDIWLNEGLATYLETRWGAARGGASMTRWLRARYEEHSSAGDPFWELRLDDPGPDALFAWPVYLRGAMAVQALRTRIGAEPFQRLLRVWAHRTRPASTPAFEETAERISGQDLATFFDAWLRADHAPSPTAEFGLGPSAEQRRDGLREQ